MIIECTDEARPITNALVACHIPYEYRVLPIPSTNPRLHPSWIARITFGVMTSQDVEIVVRICEREIDGLVHDFDQDPVHGMIYPAAIRYTHSARRNHAR